MVASGRPNGNIFEGNTLIGGLESIKLKEADRTQFLDNEFEDATTIRFDDATETLMTGNSGLNGVELKLRNSACFDVNSDDEFDFPC